MPICMLLGPLWQSCHAWVTYRSVCRVVIATTDQVTCGMISHVRLGRMQRTDMCDKHMDVQNMCNKCMNHQNTCNEHMNCQNTCDEHRNGLNPHTTHSNSQSDEHTSNMNIHDDKTT